MIVRCYDITDSIQTETQLGLHGCGFCVVPDSVDPSGISFIFHGGCSWNDYTGESESFDIFRFYRPNLKSFVSLPTPLNTGCRYRHTLTLRYRKSFSENKKDIKELYIFGGVVEPKYCRDFYKFDISHPSSKWKRLYLDGCKSLKRLGFHTSLYSYSTDQIFYFGGKNLEGRRNEILICSFKNKNWTILEPEAGTEEFEWPSKRAGHSMNWIDEEKFIIFGGMNDGGRDLNETWVYSIQSNTWEHWRDSLSNRFYGIEGNLGNSKNCDIPTPRASHSSFKINQYLYVCGGASVLQIGEDEEISHTEYVVHSDLFRLNLRTRKWERIEISNGYFAPAYIRFVHPYYTSRKSDFSNEQGKLKCVTIGGLECDHQDKLTSSKKIFELEFEQKIGLQISEISNVENYLCRSFRKALFECSKFQDVIIRVYREDDHLENKKAEDCWFENTEEEEEEVDGNILNDNFDFQNEVACLLGDEKLDDEENSISYSEKYVRVRRDSFNWCNKEREKSEINV